MAKIGDNFQSRGLKSVSIFPSVIAPVGCSREVLSQLFPVITANLLSDDSSAKGEDSRDFFGFKFFMPIEHQIEAGVLEGELYASAFDHLEPERG